jgi:3-oxoacyl-[acyl-carrier-protein] synthase-3
MEAGMTPNAVITGWGMYAPSRVMTNDELATMVDTSDEWIVTRTGIRERRIAAEDETTTTLSVHAARDALAVAGVDASEVDLVIVGTCSPDYPLPATAVLVATELGATRAAGFDLQAACSGFLYALATASGFIRSGMYRNVVVVGVEVLSRFINWRDRNTCVLFGDGAGAAILQNRPDTHGLLTACMGADGSKADLLSLPGGGSRCPPTAQSLADGLHYLRMDGKETFKSAVNAMHTAAQEALRRCEVDVAQIKCIIPHQANRRIIDAVGERLGATPEQVFVNLHKYGNTSAASVAIALDEAVSSGRIQRGDLILLLVFGAGLTWGAAVIEW